MSQSSEDQLSSPIIIEHIGESAMFNPFEARQEELLASALDECGLINPKTEINGMPAKELAQQFYQRRKLYRESLQVGKVLVGASVITSQQLNEALEIQKKSTRAITEIIDELGYSNEKTVRSVLRTNRHLIHDRRDDNGFRARLIKLLQGLMG